MDNSNNNEKESCDIYLKLCDIFKNKIKDLPEFKNYFNNNEIGFIQDRTNKYYFYLKIKNNIRASVVLLPSIVDSKNLGCIEIIDPNNNKPKIFLMKNFLECVHEFKRFVY